MVGIVVISFNHSVFTKRCVESILKYTDPAQYKLCLVDNGSWDETKEWARSLQTANKIHTFIDNDDNIGACAAANQGKVWALNDSKIENVFLLANDHLVSADWLTPLLNMEADYGNPFTFFSSKNFIDLDTVVNASFFEKHKQLRIKYFNDVEREEDLDKILLSLYGDYDSFVDAFKNRHVSQPYLKDYIFSQWPGAVFYRKHVIEKVGLKDENFIKFTKAGFADIDYMVRVALEGFEYTVAMQSYLHHWGSITTRKLGLKVDDVYKKTNMRPDWPGARKYFQKKWGTLSPGKILKDRKK